MKTLSYVLLLPVFACLAANLAAQEAVEDAPSPFAKPAPATDPASGQEANASKPAVDIKTASDLRAVVRTNIHAWASENLVLLRSTTHSESPLIQTSDLMARHIFDRFKLKYTLTKVIALKADEEEAKVEVHQTTEKLEGPAFRNNRAIVVHTLKKDSGKWKMWSSKVKLLQFLE